MPGPGGGARGGGGGRGGSFGGGRPGGGSFGGGRPGGMPPHGGFHRPPPPHAFYGGWRRRRYYGGGGCLGGLMNMIMVPILFIVIAGIVLVSSVSSALTAAANGGIVEYDEEKFQDYTDVCYAEEFGRSSSYEDHILITVLVDPENYSTFYYMAWVGDHIATDINNMFGGNYTELGEAMNASVNYSSYKYSLDSNLAAVMETMTEKVAGLELASAFKCSEAHDQITPHLTNRSSLSLTESTVNDALATFTETTGISIVIVVDEMEAAFGRTMPGSYVVTIVICAVFVCLGVWMIIRFFRERKRQNDGPDGSTYGNNSGFNDRY